MKNYWKILLCVAITLSILAGCKKRNGPYNRQPDSAGTPPAPVQTPQTFDPKVAQVVGRVYYYANPLSDHSVLVELVQQNKAVFTENSDVIRCAKALGSILFRQAAISFGENDYNKAYGRALEMGATGEQARGVADSMQSGTLDLFMLGQELLWLAEVLPSAADGDWGPFKTTGTETRIMARQLLPLMNMMLESDPDSAAIKNAVMQQYQPIVEEQMVWLAIMTGVCK